MVGELDRLVAHRFLNNMPQLYFLLDELEVIKLLTFVNLPTGSDTNIWTEVTLPQLSVPRAGHAIITMETASHSSFSEEREETGSVHKTVLVFGGGDNEGNFYSDLTVISVEELLAAV